MIGSSDLPRDDTGAPVGTYRLRVGDLTETYPGADFRDGVADRVPGRIVARLVEAFGEGMGIRPADVETAEACARHIYETTGDGERAKAVRSLFRNPRRRGRGKRAKKAPGKAQKASE